MRYPISVLLSSCALRLPSFLDFPASIFITSGILSVVISALLSLHPAIQATSDKSLYDWELSIIHWDFTIIVNEIIDAN